VIFSEVNETTPEDEELDNGNEEKDGDIDKVIE
jgi:hypothetical protein